MIDKKIFIMYQKLYGLLIKFIDEIVGYWQIVNSLQSLVKILKVIHSMENYLKSQKHLIVNLFIKGSLSKSNGEECKIMSMLNGSKCKK